MENVKIVFTKVESKVLSNCVLANYNLFSLDEHNEILKYKDNVLEHDEPQEFEISRRMLNKLKDACESLFVKLERILDGKDSMEYSHYLYVLYLVCKKLDYYYHLCSYSNLDIDEIEFPPYSILDEPDEDF